MATFTVWIPLLYLLCNYGERVTEAYSDLNEQVYEQNWYLCPSKLQLNFVLVLMTAQRPVYLEGFTGITCSLETYKKVNFTWNRTIIFR